MDLQSIVFDLPESTFSALGALVRWCVDHIRSCLDGLPRNEACLRVNGRLARVLDAADPAHFSQNELHEFVDELQVGIADLHDEIARTWFLPLATATVV